MRALTIALCLLATPALADVAGVASVIDGDTLEIQGQRIRLHGIDAPESRQLWRWVSRTVDLDILLAYLNADLLCHVDRPRHVVLASLTF